MMRGFRNHLDWWSLTTALIVWAAHFLLLWAASSIFPDQAVARWLALAFTLAALGALLWLWLNASRPALVSVAGLGIAIAAGGTAFNALPALIG